MSTALHNMTQALVTGLGSQLEAIFLFGSQATAPNATADSDTNLLLIISPETRIRAIRQTVFPIWQEHKTLLKRAPLVANRQALQRHLRLNPHLALDLLRNGQQLAGGPMPDGYFRVPINPAEVYAHLTQQLLTASTALSQSSEPEAWRLLNRLFRQIGNKPAAEAETAVAQFSAVQQALTAVLNQLPAAQTWHKAAQTGPTSPTIPGLQAIYTENSKNIFVFNQLTPRQVGQINWQALARYLPQSSASLHITTVAQFCLMALFEKALDLRFNKYQHRWGIHFLEKLTPSRHQILRQAARVPSHILVDDLPYSYLTAPNSSDDTLHKLIHDYQNRLLNVRLENELLFRLGLIPAKFAPAEPLPAREVPPAQRLDAIFQHLEWWSDFYQSALQLQP